MNREEKKKIADSPEDNAAEDNSAVQPVQPEEEKPAKPARKKRAINTRSLKHGTLSVVLTVVFIAVVVVANIIVGILSERFDTAADLTDEGIYSLEEDTERFLNEQLSSDVTITVLTPEADFEAQGSHYKQINEILKKIEMTGGHVSLRYLDVDQNPNYSAQFKGETLAANYIVVESEKMGRHRIITPYDYFQYNEQYAQYYGQFVVEGSNIEQEAVSAMMYVSNDDPVKIAFTEGYGEQDSTALQTVLSKNGYDVTTINLTTDEISEDTDFVVIFAPKLDIDNDNLSKIDRFLDNGGAFGKNVFYFASTEQEKTPNIDSFLADWGIEVGYSVIGQTDENYLISNYTAYAHLQQILDTDYAGTTYGNSLYTFGAYIRPVVQLWEGGSRGGVEQQILMTTYDKAFLFPLDTENPEDFSLDSAESGTFNDAVVAYRVHSSTTELSRVAVFGSSDLADSSFMSLNNSNNQDFFINMFNYISGKTDTVKIKSKSFGSSSFEMSAQTANTLAVVLCVVIPIAVIVLGIVIWVRRRHR